MVEIWQSGFSSLPQKLKEREGENTEWQVAIYVLDGPACYDVDTAGLSAGLSGLQEGSSDCVLRTVWPRVIVCSNKKKGVKWKFTWNRSVETSATTRYTEISFNQINMLNTCSGRFRQVTRRIGVGLWELIMDVSALERGWWLAKWVIIQSLLNKNTDRLPSLLLSAANSRDLL